jgi:hypothetical protein
MKPFLLDDLEDSTLDAVLSLPPAARVTYYKKLLKAYFPEVKENTEEYTNILETYNSSFYLEKMYRTNKFFNEKFTVVYTDKGFIRNIIADLYFADDDLITH